MIHYGDITKISGYDVPITDCVVGGSPCQDLSVAGKRAGLDGERSGLFMEQIRIIKEMRDKDARSGRTGEFIRPRFMVWENVPGAFSSNKGEDFRIVLEETAKVIDKDAVIPMPQKNKWTTSGCIVGDGRSIAWRILDAQFWGVPQRRRRITLVADFGGGCAQEILFVKDSLRGDSSESRTERKSSPTDAQGCIGVYDRDGKTYGFPLGFRPENVRCYEEKATTLCVGTRAGFCNGVIALEPGIASREGGHIYEDVSGTLTASMNSSGNNKLAVIDSTAYCIGNGQVNDAVCPDKELCKTLNCMDDPMKVLIVKEEPVICLQGNQIDQADTSVCNGSGFKEGTSYTLNVRDRHAVVFNGENITNPLNKTNPQIGDPCHSLTSDRRNYLVETKPHYIVRRLTPLECERLQGYEDGWTDIGEYIDSKGKTKKTSDTVRYKALGNSIALPPWKWIIKRLSAQYERDATLASLFDGIGGFPLLWEQINGKGSCLWASEIEDFPIAVTKVRIE